MKNIKLRDTDIAALIYIGLNILYMIFGWNRFTNHRLLLEFSLIPVIIFLLIRFARVNPIIDFFRNTYPLILFPYFFEVTSDVNRIIYPNYLDGFFQKVDFNMLGYQPALEWGKMLDGWFWQELFHFAYFSYYMMFAGLCIFLLFNRKEQFSRFLFILSFVYYICFITYMVLPVIGGRWWEIMEGYRKVTVEYRYGAFTRIMAWIYSNTTHRGGAFPSSHVAIALVTTIAAVEQKLKVSWVFIPLTILLAISTVHCHYHYFIDTIFGVIYAFMFYKLGAFIYQKREIVQEKNK